MTMRYTMVYIAMILGVCSSFSQQYYPLTVGNRWDYQEVYSDFYGAVVDSGSFSVAIIDTVTMSNGRIYFKLNKPDISGGQYVRVDTAGVYYWFESDSSKESLVYKFNANVGDFWEVNLPPTYYVYLGAVDTMILFGQTTSVLFFGLDGLIASDVTLSDKFGPIHYHTTGESQGLSHFNRDLLGCVIGDTTYGLLVSVHREAIASPATFSLLQCYPNPSNARVMIPFETQVAAVVNIEIFNSIGQKVFDKVRYYTPGRHTVPWESANHPSGVYYYRLSSNAFSDTKRSVIIK